MPRVAVPRTSGGRTLAFRIIAGLFGSITLVFTLLFLVGSFTDETQSVHRFHNLGGAVGYGLLLPVPLLFCAWRPMQTAVFRLTWAVALASIVGGLVAGDFVSGTYFVAPIVFVILILLHPAREELFRFERPDAPELALALVAAVPLVVYAWNQADLMSLVDPSNDPTGHWEMHHWSGMAVTALSLVLAAALTAFGGRARRTAAWLVGVGGMLLGLGSLAYPDLPSVFDTPWAVAALVWGAAYVVAGELLDRRSG